MHDIDIDTIFQCFNPSLQGHETSINNVVILRLPECIFCVGRVKFNIMLMLLKNR